MLSTATFTLTTATLVFSGRGRVRLVPGGSVKIAPAAADLASNSTSVQVLAPLELEFFEPTDVYASGLGSPTLEVIATDLPRAVGLEVSCS